MMHRDCRRWRQSRAQSIVGVRWRFLGFWGSAANVSAANLESLRGAAIAASDPQKKSVRFLHLRRSCIRHAYIDVDDSITCELHRFMQALLETMCGSGMSAQ